jgi:hypothetical protein
MSLLTLLPSTWWAAVAAPQRKPFGNATDAFAEVPAAMARTVPSRVAASPAAASPPARKVRLVTAPVERLRIDPSAW